VQCALSAPIYDPACRDVRQWHTAAVMPPERGLYAPMLASAARCGGLSRWYVR